MAENYAVNYTINVEASQALQVLQNFQAQVNALTKVASTIDTFTSSVVNLNSALSLFQKERVINIKLHGTTTNHIKERTAAIQQLNQALIANHQLNGTLSSGYMQSAGYNNSQTNTSGTTRNNNIISNSSKKGNVKSSKTYTSTSSYNRAVARPMIPNNMGYKLIGPTPLPNNGGMAISMLQGMGIAYGISGIGSIVSEVVSQASEYDNIIKTVENILKTHDSKGNFANRFENMQAVIRKVGIETKFKATEVADAAKFLSMAGLGIEAIQASIRPIADIALIGDTELGETADLVTNVMTAYNIDPERMRMAADIMTNTFTMSNTTLTEIAEAYKYSASLLSAGGISFEEATSAIGILGDAGIKGSQAGTTLRTILANFANPTKKQQAAWDKIGISAKDENGEVRPFVDIFKDLASKNLGVADFYKLFHKTAASGAAALTLHVDHWNDVLLENFISGGVSKKLADEKKNTLKGLWAQLTSIFTDNGINAFSSIDREIRDLLQRTINWLFTDKAKNSIMNLTKGIMEFINIMIGATKTFYNWFGMLSPIIKTWVKFQLYITPIVKAFAALKTVIIGLSGLRLLGLNIQLLASSMGLLKKNATGIGASLAPMGAAGSAHTPYGIVAGSPYLPAATWKDQAVSGKGLNFERPHSTGSKSLDKKLFKKYKKTRETYNRRVVQRQLYQSGLGYLKMGLGGLGMYLGADALMDDENTLYGKWAGGSYGIAGIIAMSSTGPIGYISAAVMAAVGGILKVIDTIKQAENAASKIHEMHDRYVVKEGVLVDQKATGIEKYLQLVRQENHNINEELALRIARTRELLGLESNGESKDANASTDTFTKTFTLMKKGGDLSDAPLQAQIQEIAKYQIPGLQLIGNTIRGKRGGIGSDWSYKDYHKTISINGVTSNNLTYEAMAGNMAIIEEAVTGNFTKLIKNDFYNRQIKAVLNNDFEALKKITEDFNKLYGPDTFKDIDYHPLWEEGDWEEFAKNPDYIKNNGIFQRILYNTLMPSFGEDNDIVKTYENFHEAINNNSSDLVDTFIKLSKYMGNIGISMSNFGTEQWLLNQGWNGSTFIPIGDNENGLQQAKSVVLQIQQQKKIWEKSGASILDNEGAKQMVAIWDDLLLKAQGYIALVGETSSLPQGWTPPDGMLIPYNGSFYKYDASKGDWIQQDFDKPNVVTTVELMLGKSKMNKVNLLDIISDLNSSGYNDTSSDTSDDTSSDTSDDTSNTDIPTTTDKNTPNPYKSHYSNNSSAPKQIIVRIGNLMQVDKIDMTDPSKREEVVNNLKRELASALIDVVADFDENMA